MNTGTTARAIRLLLQYYQLTGDTRFLSGIPNAIDFLESMKLPAEEAAKWRRKTKSEEEILVPRFVHPETGQPQYVHRKGSNVANGTYYIDQNIEKTIVHYSSVYTVNPSALRRNLEEVKKIPLEELTANSPFTQNKLVPLDKYYTGVRGKVDDATIKQTIKSLNKDGYWPSLLRSVSNVYKPCPEQPVSDTEEYAETMVGDEFDTSCYYATEEIPCISVSVYIQNMIRLAMYLENNK